MEDRFSFQERSLLFFLLCMMNYMRFLGLMLIIVKKP